MERTKLFQRKGKESHWHWQRKGSRKRWNRWCEIIRTSTPKTQSQCWNCQKTGYQYKNCWLGRWPQPQSQGHANSLGKGSVRRASQAKVVGRKENPKMMEHLCGINSRVQLRAQLHRPHYRQRQAQRLARLTRLSAQRWICARVH